MVDRSLEADDTLARFKERRNQGLRDLDMEYARQQMPAASNDHVRLIAMHKARYECTDLEPQYRHTSREWLAGHSYSRLDGSALLPVGELPE